MSNQPDYRIPSTEIRTEIVVVNSRFITTIAPAASVDEAKEILARVRAEMPDANHHVYAYRIGHGNSVIDGMSDDGEPSGTAGPPVLAVLRGTGLGDVIVIITRYFGGTKLGTGGLVRAYSEAARTGLNAVPTELKIERRTIGIELPYNLYELTKRLIHEHEGTIEDETFAGEVTIMAIFPVRSLPGFKAALSELSAGRIEPIELDNN